MTANTNAALAEYANPLNWEADENGIRRIWLEPGSYTPDAYNGFELARAALSAAAPAQPDASYAELADKLQYGSVAFGSDSEWVSIRRYIRDEAVAALRAAHGQAPAPTTQAAPAAALPEQDRARGAQGESNG